MERKTTSFIRSRVAKAAMVIVAVAVAGVCLSTGESGRHDARNNQRAASLDPGRGLKEARELVDRAVVMIYETGDRSTPGAIPMFTQARETLDRAGTELADGHAAEALDLTARAREMLRTAAQLASREITSDFIEKRLAELDELRAESENLASVCSAPGVRDLMSRGDERLRLAREYAGADKLDYAEAQATIAYELYTRIMKICAKQ
jgi:hypothetical protein